MSDRALPQLPEPHLKTADHCPHQDSSLYHHPKKPSSSVLPCFHPEECLHNPAMACKIPKYYLFHPIMTIFHHPYHFPENPRFQASVPLRRPNRLHLLWYGAHHARVHLSQKAPRHQNSDAPNSPCFHKPRYIPGIFRPL